MYVETKDKMEQEVNEATVALKGMLGIADSPTEMTTTDSVKQGDEAQEEPTQSTKKKKSAKKKKKTNEQQNKQQEANDNSAKSKKDRSSSNKKSKQKGKKKQKENENYAWSAFQSSPDASKLPIPEFSSPTSEKKAVSVAVEEDGAAVSAPLDPIPMSAAPEEGGTDVKANTSTDITEGTTSPDTTTTEKAPVSKTGINLAALASTPPAPKQEHPSKTTPPQSAPGPVMHGNHPMPFSAPPPTFQQQPQQHHHPGYSRPQHYGPMPPPGFVTIPVQVPPVLMPGRQMVVPSPAGYPVQVAVPENIPPGAIISVHVPAGPPMHMMPPYGGRYYNNNPAGNR